MLEARIVAWEAASVPKVPTISRFRSGSGWGVFVVEAGRARLREVAVDHRGEAEAEVLGGLRAGETMALYPLDRSVTACGCGAGD